MSESQQPALKTVYVKLFEEAVDVIRPTSAVSLGQGKYQLLPPDNYDPEDEHWEFVPGSIVEVVRTTIDGKLILLAISLAKENFKDNDV
ncbi:hypothetical protein [Tunturibacter empetritectus]|uniref:Uncharacterized protein n=1 Tax=Tunturiibacter empetritectus TaxID=3069691 RepID=A0A7W8MQR4_9BACT|nr:hypothetical protein [Edaphobacter lichenicola]MBB5316090.1 hypothetical protein [Edaphobacter lichenicola]